MRGQTQFVQELFADFSVRIRFGKGKTVFGVRAKPGGVTVAENGTSIELAGDGWTASVGDVMNARVQETQRNEKSGRRLTLVDSNGKSTLRMDVRRMTDNKVAAFDKLRSKYASFVEDAPVAEESGA